MPTVPRYERQVGPQAGPNIAFDTTGPSAEALGVGQSKQNLDLAINENIQKLDRIAAEEKKKADDVRITGAYADLAGFKNDLIYNPQKGILTKQGDQAFGVIEEYTPQFDKRSQEIEKSLTNPEQIAAFRKIKDDASRDLNDHMQRHIYGESQKYAKEKTNSAVTNARNEAVLNYNDPERISNSLALQRQFIIQQAAREGISSEGVKVLLGQAQTDTHADIIKRMLTNDEDQAADAYFNQVKDQIDGQKIGEIEGWLEAGKLRGESQRLTAEIVGKHPLNLREITLEVDKIKDPKLQDEVRRRAEHAHSINQQARDEYLERRLNDAALKVEKEKSVDGIPPHLWAEFTPSHRAMLERLAEPKPIQTDQVLYSDLKIMGALPATREKFLKTDLNQFRGRLSTQDFQELVNYKVGLLNKKDDTLKIADGIISENQAVENATLGILKLDPKKDKDEILAFRFKLNEQVVAKQRQTGKEMSTEEIANLAEIMATDVVVKKRAKFLPDSKKPLYLLDRGKPFDVKVSNIPPRSLEQLKQALVILSKDRNSEYFGRVGLDSNGQPTVFRDEDIRKLFVTTAQRTASGN